MIELRPYQIEAIAALDEAIASGVTRNIVSLPTGTGKTMLGLSWAKGAGTGRVLWLAHREELVRQPIRSLRVVWPEATPGVCMANENTPDAQIVFATVQTVFRDKRLDDILRHGKFDRVIVDECHHAPARTWVETIRKLGCFDGVPLLGLTATPERSDQIKLSTVFEQICYQMHLSTAIDRGYLVPPLMVKEAINVDLDAIETSNSGDFNERELNQAMVEEDIVDAICDAYAKHCLTRKTMIFCVSVKQSELISDRLNARGYKAGCITQSTKKVIRRFNLQEFANGNMRILVNCMVLTEGFDDPSMNAIIMARPTTSKPLYVQSVGRGLRTHPGKDNCLVIDMVGVSKRHTLVYAPVIFGIEEKEDDDSKERATVINPQSSPLDTLISQVKGVIPASRTALKWMQLEDGTYCISAGDRGTIIIQKQDGELYSIESLGGRDCPDRQSLAQDWVDLHLAQGIAEDYIRRAGMVKLSGNTEAWRDHPASDKQKEYLAKLKIDFDDKLTKGQVSDLITLQRANSWRYRDPTPKQKGRLRMLGIETPPTMSRGEASRILRDSAIKPRA